MAVRAVTINSGININWQTAAVRHPTLAIVLAGNLDSRVGAGDGFLTNELLWQSPNRKEIK
jgi:hypothetical protein